MARRCCWSASPRWIGLHMTDAQLERLPPLFELIVQLQRQIDAELATPVRTLGLYRDMRLQVQQAERRWQPGKSKGNTA